MNEPSDITPETAEKLIRAILDPTGIHGMKPDEPLPLKAVLYNAGYFAGASKAEQVVKEIMEGQKEEARSIAASYILKQIEEGTLDGVGGGALTEAGHPSDDATLVAVMEAGAPEWNEYYGDDYRSGHMAGFLDFLEENLVRYLENNT